LLELSAVPLPANPGALIADYKSKGRPIPSWLTLTPTPETPTMAENATDETAAAPGGDDLEETVTKAVETAPIEQAADDETLVTKDAAACACGKSDCKECTKDDDGDEDDMETEADPDEPEPDGDDDDPRTTRPPASGGATTSRSRPPITRASASSRASTSGATCPNVEQDVMGTADEPAARVKCYKAFGDGHKPTDDHVGVMCKHLTKMAEPMTAPTKKAAPAVATKGKAHARRRPLTSSRPPNRCRRCTFFPSRMSSASRSNRSSESPRS
jgi:hypothetical protein